MFDRRIRTGLAWLGMAVIGTGTLQAQQQLSGPEATYPEAFSLVQRVLELPDGRVMVADPLGEALVVVDLGAGTADTLGNIGQGPEEYRQPDVVWPLPGDSVLLVDLGNARLTVIDPNGAFGETRSIAQNSPDGGPGLMIVLPRGVDSQGRVYIQPFGGGRPGAQLPDSVAIVRWDRRDGALDTVSLVKIAEMKRTASGDNVNISPIPMSAEDAWAVGWDGRVAVARSGDYHVEIISPDGSVIRGEPVDYKPVRIRTADKEEWVDGLGNGLRIGISISNGERQMAMGRGGGSSTPDINGFEWPDEKPPFASSGVYVTPEGDVWVERSVSAGEPPLIDVFGGDANPKGQIVLPVGRDVVGFGRGTVYLIRTDDMGLQWLEKYRRPAT